MLDNRAVWNDRGKVKRPAEWTHSQKKDLGCGVLVLCGLGCDGVVDWWTGGRYAGLARGAAVCGVGVVG